MSIVKGEKVCYNIDAIKEEVQSNGQIGNQAKAREPNP